MTTTINASPSNGIVATGDGSGVMKLQSNGVTTNALAWVNFNGTTASPSTIRSSYNVTSVTKNGTGLYTLNFTNALSDANYACVGCVGPASSGSESLQPVTLTTTTAYVTTTTQNAGQVDRANVCVAIFGN